MIDDWMSLVFLIYHTSDALLGYILFRMRFTDLHGVACLSPLTRYTPRRGPVRYIIIFLSGAFLEPLSQTRIFRHLDVVILLIRDTSLLMRRSDSIVDLDYGDQILDDG